MANDVKSADIHEVLERYHVRYEVRPYCVVLDERPTGAAPTEQRVQAGFDVNFYSALETSQMPLFRSEGVRSVVDYFESVAQEVQLKVGQRCTVEIIPYTDSVVFDTHQHFRPEAMLQIRISHDRGLDQPAGPAEEQAPKAIQERLHQLGVREV